MIEMNPRRPILRAVGAGAAAQCAAGRHGSRASHLSASRYSPKSRLDDEGRPNAVDSDVLRHLRNLPNVDVSIRVVAVSPMHEAWLCIGLGYDRRSCRSDPVGVLRSEKYEKRHLGQWAERMSVDQLMSVTNRTLVASPDTAALRTSLLNLLSHLRTGLGSILIFAGGFNTRLSASFLITALWNSLP